MARFTTRDDGNILSIVDETTNETLIPYAPVVWKEDFTGQAIDGTNSPLALLDTGGGAETTSADAANGAASIALDATSEAQLAGISGGDQRTWILNQNLIFEAKVRFSVLPTTGTIVFVGLAGDHNATLDTVAESVGFRLDGATGGLITVENDDTSHETSKVTTGITALTTEEKILRIDCSNIADVKFFVNGQRVAASTTFNMNTVAGLKLQPYVRVNKASGTSVGTVLVDYLSAWQNRS